MQLLGMLVTAVMRFFGTFAQEDSDDGDYMAGTRLIVDAKGPGRVFTEDLLDYEL